MPTFRIQTSFRKFVKIVMKRTSSIKMANTRLHGKYHHWLKPALQNAKSFLDNNDALVKYMN